MRERGVSRYSRTIGRGRAPVYSDCAELSKRTVLQPAFESVASQELHMKWPGRGALSKCLILSCKPRTLSSHQGDPGRPEGNRSLAARLGAWRQGAQRGMQGPGTRDVDFGASASSWTRG